MFRFLLFLSRKRRRAQGSNGAASWAGAPSTNQAFLAWSKLCVIYVYTYAYIHTYKCMCVHIHIYICICAYIYMCIYIYVHMCIYVYMYIHAHIQVQMQIYINKHLYIYICTYVYLYIYMCIYTYICICIYIYVYTYTCMYIYIYADIHAHLPNYMHMYMQPVRYTHVFIFCLLVFVVLRVPGLQGLRCRNSRSVSGPEGVEWGLGHDQIQYSMLIGPKRGSMTTFFQTSVSRQHFGFRFSSRVLLYKFTQVH